MNENVKVGDKVKVTFESGNRLTGTVTEVIEPGKIILARFGRGEDRFTSVVQWTTWNGYSFSWKENIGRAEDFQKRQIELDHQFKGL